MLGHGGRFPSQLLIRYVISMTGSYVNELALVGRPALL